VLVLFVAATVLLLRVVHPVTTTATSAAGLLPSTTTTTTHPVPPTTTIPSARVPVMVANASGVAGAAAAVTKELQPHGWDLLPPVNATASASASSVYYLAGFEPEARAVAGDLQLAAGVVVPYTTAAPISSIGAAQVLVVVGPDLANAAKSAATTAATAAQTATTPAH
jgi:hypothetical protein